MILPGLGDGAVVIGPICVRYQSIQFVAMTCWAAPKVILPPQTPVVEFVLDVVLGVEVIGAVADAGVVWLRPQVLGRVRCTIQLQRD